jgi:aryl-alcohol dehydrogenase-like predicted oxidoreductase
LILGTAQFGLNYGISNKLGKLSIDQAKEILEVAHAHGVQILDTAFAYGASEKVLGDLNENRFEIISKLPDLSKIEFTADHREISNLIQRTLVNTKQKQLHAYLLHTIDNLKFNGKVLWRQMQDFKEQGLTKKIGYSLYSPKQLELYFDQFKPDIVQIPMNILDREFQKSGWLKRLKDNGVEIHVRSVFLQGLLLMQYEEQMIKFPMYKSIWDLLRYELNVFEDSALNYCLGFIKGITEIDSIVVGVNSALEFKGIAASNLILRDVSNHLTSSDENLIYPFNWKI